MANAPKAPCRLSVILARRAPIGVIFRRGPSGWVQLILWRTDRDTFEHGQWFRAKVEADHADLSPSGKLLVYFAVSYRERSIDRGYAGTWTAVSHPPYFTALALWPLGDTWFGGGIFDDEDVLRLNHPEHKLECHPKHRLTADLRVAADARAFWERSLLTERMARDGWILRSTMKKVVGGRKIAGTYPHQWEKPDPKGRRILRGPSHYSVVYGKTGEEAIAFDAEWADWDQAGKLAYTSGGRLYRVAFAPRGRSVDTREIADFNGARPDPKAAPEWATRW